MKATLQAILLIPLLCIFGFTFWLASWTASYLPYSDDWKDHVVFTPASTQDPSQIYLVDMYLYAFRYSPFETIVCTISFIMIVVVLFLLVKAFWDLKLSKKIKEV
ncbi:DUF4306 domain-containing protein [Anaerobacillus sp. 1_MG-2023]|uniref:DUF4306 domain-containing protein n=1 Tax=Anaerobacillus sp. 1_MG-2023 TaxID=3062655 RepID=UPI0026E26D55|nr:DUF4306 domain-containing protein [Anaerobacillus sp. 1_MG-2023]MDO6657341.1 DUF4306 domain-containing protein [Anaerobacillus sp. 1_MG-2023]